MEIICITPLKHQKELYKLLKKFGKIIYKPEISKFELKKILDRNKNIRSIFCNPNKQNYVLDKEILANSGIRVINTASTGLNHINIKDCIKLNINIISLKNDFRLLKKLPSTSELAFSLMICLLKKINQSFESVKKNNWNYEPFVGNELSSLSVGIIGFGRLGNFMSNFCKSFGMKVYIYDPYKKTKKFINSSLNSIAKNCDVISIHVHVKDDTTKIISSKFLKKLEKKPIIINTSRGEVVSEKDIIIALKKDFISGYGTDVIEDEFGEIRNSPILKGIKKKLNILVTPHVGGMTWQGQRRAWIWSISKFDFINKFIKRNLRNDELFKLDNIYKKKQKVYE
tara:strand:+ start:2275 stop:3297 length:1023 start_codon:yes stop_codon:yes gene_type:complete